MQPGQEVAGRYMVAQYLAEGGMQQVFEAIDSSFERSVALKVPKNATAEKRFERSAQVSARVTHANVAKTLDYFEDGGTPCLIEELISGEDLGRALDREYLYLDPHLAAHVFYQLAKGLGAAHHAGVFHRDMKPSNIMVSDDPNLSIVKITDFGIAKMAGRELEEAVEGGESSLTTSQTAMGALPYMAPELIETPKQAEKPADIWAVGAILYKLLSGNLPFGSGLRAVPTIIAANLPPKPALLDSKEQYRNLGEDLWAIIALCLQRDPSKRPSADELISRCAELCYSEAKRHYGVIEDFKSSRGRWGYILNEEDQRVFYHEDSYYGDRPAAGKRVSFASFPGHPADRAFPVLPLRPVEST